MTKKLFTSLTMLLCCMALLLSACDNKKKKSQDEDEEEATELSSEDQSNNYERLKRIASEANAQCPVSLGIIGEMTSIVLTDDVLTFRYDIDETYLSVSVLANDREAMRENSRTMLSNPSGDMKKLLQYVIDAGCKLKMTMHGTTSDAVASVTFNADELEEAMNTDVSPQQKLETSIQSTQAQLPITMNNGIVLTEMKQMGNDVVYIYKLDADTYSIDNFRRNSTEAKNSIMNELKNGGPVEKEFVRIVFNAGANLVYRYQIGSSHIDFKITNDELQTLQ